MAKKKKDKHSVHKDLEGFDIKINAFGEIVSSKRVDELNEFLDENVTDKKLAGRSDADEGSAEEE